MFKCTTKSKCSLVDPPFRKSTVVPSEKHESLEPLDPLLAIFLNIYIGNFPGKISCSILE